MENPDNKNNDVQIQNEVNPGPIQSTDTSEMTPNQYLEQIQSGLKNRSDVVHEFITDKVGETLSFDRSNTPRKAVLYWKGNKNCNHTLGKRATPVKLMIQDCHDSIFTINCPITTGVIELWRCTNITLHINTDVGTLQLDLSENLTISYNHKKYLGSIIQAGVTNLNIQFKDAEECNIITGLQVLKQEFSTLEINDNFDQFMTRWVNKELKTELVIRTQGGYPTTERELQEIEELDMETRNKMTMEKLLGQTGQAMGIDEKSIIAKSIEGKAQLEEKSKIDSQVNLKKYQGGKEYTKGNYPRAIEIFSEAIALAPDNHLLYSNRAACYIQISEWEKGLEDSSKCTQLQDDFAKGHYRKGLCLIELGRLHEARGALNEAYDLEPEDNDIKQKYDFVKQQLNN